MSMTFDLIPVALSDDIGKSFEAGDFCVVLLIFGPGFSVTQSVGLHYSLQRRVPLLQIDEE